MQPALSPLTRLCAAFLLGSVLVGVMAPGAVAMSRTDIQHAAGQEGLSSKVQDFLNGVLEDAMLRAGMVSPASPTAQKPVRSTDDRPPVFVIATGVMESVPAGSIFAVETECQLLLPGELPERIRQGTASPRAP